MSATSAPALARAMARLEPTNPPPTTMTSSLGNDMCRSGAGAFGGDTIVRSRPTMPRPCAPSTLLRIGNRDANPLIINLNQGMRLDKGGDAL